MGVLRKSTMNKIGIGLGVALALFICKPSAPARRGEEEGSVFSCSDYSDGVGRCRCMGRRWCRSVSVGVGAWACHSAPIGSPGLPRCSCNGCPPRTYTRLPTRTR